METLNIVLWVIGVLALAESLFGLIFTKQSVKICKKMGFKKMCKNVKSVTKIAAWEFVIAVILIILAIYL
jgi:hypothetical protein